jgi:GNAT superfamily N-acetyltransferase
MTLPNGLLLVANLLGAAVGCGALKLHIDTQIAEVKRMWVASEVRGLGLGRRLLERLSAEAVSRGMVILRLETNRSLSEAKASLRESWVLSDAYAPLREPRRVRGSSCRC